MPGESNPEAPTTQTAVVNTGTDEILPPAGDRAVPLGKAKLLSSHGKLNSQIIPNQFESNGHQNFIFLGDFVDRGYFSLETFTLLMCLKAK
jgi:serine/threonine-protein phosphatase PP1-1